VALDGETGAVRLTAPVPRVPRRLLLAPGPAGESRRRLYCLQVEPGPQNELLERADPALTSDDRWRLLGLDLATLTPVGDLALPETLAGAGYRVAAAEAAQGARALVRRWRPAAVVLALGLPSDSGALL
jgi:hypothetical protein